MRWPWQHRPAADRCPSSTDADEATEARIEAEEQLRRDLERSADIREIAAQSRRHRRVNHFAELFSQSFEGGPR
jgi:hypothetical protein